MLVGKRRFIVAVLALCLATLLCIVIMLKSPSDASAVIQSVAILMVALLTPLMASMATDKNTVAKIKEVLDVK